MMAGRFIKLYDKILSWEWFGHPNTLCLFIYLLLKAYYKDTSVGGKMIHRGQLVTSLPKIATDTGLSIRQTRTALSHLISTGEVTDESSNQNRIITIVKYDDYQNATDGLTGKRQATDRRVDRQPTDESTPYIEDIESIEGYRKIDSPTEREKKPARFVPPSKEEVFDYCMDENLGIDVDRFYDYYSSKGWKVGNVSMKDWKAAARNWARRDKEHGKPSGQTPTKKVTAQDYSQRDYSGSQAEALRNMIANARRDGI